jgi:uncharacterized membrane protein YkoI
MMELFRRSHGVALALALSRAAFPLPAHASADEEVTTEELSGHDHDRAERARARGEIRPLEEIMPFVRDRFTGEVAHIELERDQGLWIYEFKVIDRAGRLIEVKVNAKTGAVVEIEGE